MDMSYLTFLKLKTNIKYWIILKCVATVLLCIVRSMKRSIASQKDRPFGQICPIQYRQGAEVLLACSQRISAYTERVRLVQFTLVFCYCWEFGCKPVGAVCVLFHNFAAGICS
jgi:hypothetical protein